MKVGNCKKKKNTPKQILYDIKKYFSLSFYAPQNMHIGNTHIIQNNQTPFKSAHLIHFHGLGVCLQTSIWYQTLSELQLPQYVSISATHTLKCFQAQCATHCVDFCPCFLYPGRTFLWKGDMEKLWAHIRRQLPPPYLFSSTFLWVGDGGDGLVGGGASPPCQLPLWAWGQLSAPWQLSASLWPPDPSGFMLSAQINLHIEWCHYLAPERLLAGRF